MTEPIQETPEQDQVAQDAEQAVPTTSPDVIIVTEDPGPAPEETEQSDDGSSDDVEGDPASDDEAMSVDDALSE